jgi:hypothetical protein
MKCPNFWTKMETYKITSENPGGMVLYICMSIVYACGEEIYGL